MTANTQSGIVGLRPGPRRGHAFSACWQTETLRLTSSSSGAPSVARLRIRETPFC